MNSNRKPLGRAPGKSLTELGRLKTIWRDSLSEADRAYWWSRFVSNSPQAEIRLELSKKLGVKLKSDNRLTDFRQWLAAQADEKTIADLFIEARQYPGALQLFRQVLDTLKQSKASGGAIHTI